MDRYHAKNPPAHILLQYIAQAVGVEMTGGSASSAAPEPAQQADPFAIQSLIGQAEMLPYTAPRRGFAIEEPVP